MIYILEDDDSIRKLVTYALESQGYAATGFAVPSAFYKAMKERVPSLLLLDIGSLTATDQTNTSK